MILPLITKVAKPVALVTTVVGDNTTFELEEDKVNDLFAKGLLLASSNLTWTVISPCLVNFEPDAAVNVT